MIKRELSTKINQLVRKFPVITLTGPRQSGKSTLLRNQFPDYTYTSLEDPDIREFALSDPRGFIRQFPSHAIFDEIQKAPDLFSYIQTHVDGLPDTGIYMLAGSQNFLLMRNISQTLAGRTAILRLLPFSRLELHKASLLPSTIDGQIFTGFYPRLFDKEISPRDFYPNYIQTYVERDVRDLLKVTDLNKFIKFLRLCAGRIGQILNMTALANETGISSTTAEGWLSVLEMSYICHRLEPNFNNFNKRVIKSPKLYFYDTGLACSLLGIYEEKQLETFYMRGALFENLVINQFIKDAYNKGELPDISFWRDSQGNEIDLIKTEATEMTGYEIKSGLTMNSDFFKGLDKWGKLSGTPPERLNVIYNGNKSMSTARGNMISFPEWF
ncbi:MAG: ATP-binding protein [Muribaculaceae bacterium]|nr:ATP-binding protein [Muribaculaceae bacterium]